MPNSNNNNQIKGKVSPEMFQTITMDEISWKLSKMIELLSSQIPKGVIERNTLIATTIVQEIRSKLGEKWRSISISNDGNVPIRFSINAGSVNYNEVGPGETDTIDFNYAVISWITFRTSSGTASFRFTAKR